MNNSFEKHWKFLQLAKLIGENSKCMNRQIGAILVTPDGTVVGTGYNGPARGVPHCNDTSRLIQIQAIMESRGAGQRFTEKFKEKWNARKCPRHILGFDSEEGLFICQAGHAERNVLINSARNGIKTKGCVLYCYCGIPCSPCAVEIVNAGIDTIICIDERSYDADARWILQHGKVKIFAANLERKLMFLL